MNVKKSIAIIITLVLLILPMMTMPIQAAALGKVSNVRIEKQGNVIAFYWNTVSNADGYEIFIATSGTEYKYIGSVSSSEARLIGFKEEKEYSAKVRAYQEKSNGTKSVGEFSNPITINKTEEVTLDKVKTLTASQNGGYVTLNWSKVSNATGYEIYVKVPYLDYICIGTINTNTVILQKFEDNVTYQFKVKPYQEKSDGTKVTGEFSPEKKLTIHIDKYEDYVEEQEETEPGKVRNLTINEVDGNKAYISWSKVSDADGYEIYGAKSNGKYSYIDTVYKNSATLKKLDYNTTYKIKVKAFKEGKNGLIYGEESSYQKFTTEKMQIEVGTVKNLLADINENAVEVSWSKANNAEGYEIWIKKGNGTYQYKTDTTRTNIKISNLNYNTNYTVKVIAYADNDGEREYSNNYEIVKFTTEEEQIVGQVKNLTVTVNENEATLNWSRVTGAEGYNIYVAKNGTNNFKYNKTTTSTSITLKNLDYDTTYSVKVVAYETINGREKEGKASSTKKITIAKKQVSQATHLSAEVKNKNEAYLQWWPAEGVDGYEVYLAEGSKAFKKVHDIQKSHIILYSDELDYNTRYQVKVIAYEYVNGKKQYAKDSTIASFKTEKASIWENNEDVPKVKNLRANVVGDRVYLTWNKVKNVAYYEIDFTVPGIGGSINFTVYTNSKEISGLTEKTYNYTARVRAYKYVNGRLVPGPYSEVKEFTGK